MNYKISFQAMDQLGMEKISRQLPSTLEEKETISALKEAKFSKDQEAEILKGFITHSGLWYSEIDNSNYIGEGG